MNINGSTAAASAISAPRVSTANLRRVGLAKFGILGHNSQFPKNSIKHHSERQRNSVGNFQRFRIIEGNVSSRQSECHQRDQDMPDIANRLAGPSFVDRES